MFIFSNFVLIPNSIFHWKLIYDEIIKQGLLEKSDDVADALLEMYAKCDMFEEAKEVFDTMQNPCTTSWNVLIAGYSQHGHNKEIQK